jgi:hypothetical protein
MMNRSNTGPGMTASRASWPVVRGLMCGAGLVLLAGSAVAQNKAAGPALEPFDKAQFDSRSTTINNPWLPMKPGMRYVYEGTTSKDDGKPVPHRIELNITDLTKVVMGVRVLISYDLDYSDGKLEEAELAFFAQDKAGNVWHFGQYPEEYSPAGKMTKAPAWIPPFENAAAGIMMKAEPKLGAPSYSQGYGPKVNWTDRGQTHLMGQTSKVPAGDYNDVLVIRETAEGEDGFQLKHYARGVGNIKVGWTGSDKTKEVLELVRVETLSAKDMDDVRAKTLKLEKSAYVQSKNVYAKTAPAERLPK